MAATWEPGWKGPELCSWETGQAAPALIQLGGDEGLNRGVSRGRGDVRSCWLVPMF